MLILIVKDEATKIPKECSLEEARAIQEQGFTVFRLGDAGEQLPLEDAEAPEQASEDPAPNVKPAAAKRSPAAKKTKA